LLCSGRAPLRRHGGMDCRRDDGDWRGLLSLHPAAHAGPALHAAPCGELLLLSAGRESCRSPATQDRRMRRGASPAPIEERSAAGRRLVPALLRLDGACRSGQGADRPGLSGPDAGDILASAVAGRSGYAATHGTRIAALRGDRPALAPARGSAESGLGLVLLRERAPPAVPEPARAARLRNRAPGSVLAPARRLALPLEPHSARHAP